MPGRRERRAAFGPWTHRSTSPTAAFDMPGLAAYPCGLSTQPECLPPFHQLPDRPSARLSLSRSPSSGSVRCRRSGAIGWLFFARFRGTPLPESALAANTAQSAAPTKDFADPFADAALPAGTVSPAPTPCPAPSHSRRTSRRPSDLLRFCLPRRVIRFKPPIRPSRIGTMS